MTPFGNRDFERAPVSESADEYGWEHDEALAQLLDEPSPALPVTNDTRRVVVRMNGGDDVELGRAEGREPAVRIARDMVRTIEDAEAAGARARHRLEADGLLGVAERLRGRDELGAPLDEAPGGNADPGLPEPPVALRLVVRAPDRLDGRDEHRDLELAARGREREEVV